MLDQWRAGLDQRALVKWDRELSAVYKDIFGKPPYYPEWAWSDLSPAQRAYHELMLETAQNWVTLRDPVKRESLARRIGRAPAGPADIEITLDGRERPLWCAVSDVSAGLRPATQVVEAFRTLPADVALAAWNEIARGVHEVELLPEPRAAKLRDNAWQD